MEVFYSRSVFGDQNSTMFVVDGPIDKPMVIQLPNGEKYRRVTLHKNQSGQRGQCNNCDFNERSGSRSQYCPPVHGCSSGYKFTAYPVGHKDKEVVCQTDEYVRWERCEELEMQISKLSIDVVEI